MRMRFSISTLFLLLCIAAVAWAQPGMDEMMKMAAPGPEHELLKSMTGKWKYKLTNYMDPSSPTKTSGTAKGEMMLGGRFSRFESTGKMMGANFSTFSLMGFDRRKNKYFIVECDEFGTYTVFAEGDYDKATKTLTLSGENEEEGTKVPFQFIFKLTDANHMSFSIVMEMGGPKMKMIDVEYTRA